jgi:prepilin-type N-terminal cleavage/methylation domain-containing protein/prepilin-type processing-associated H-X9-DG protein
MHCSTYRHRRVGFTLVELLVVIAIIGILVSLLLPAVQAARESGRRTQCNNNIRQIGVAMQNYHDSNGLLPTGAMPPTAAAPATSNELSWHVLILPFMEQKGLHSEFNLNASGYLANIAQGLIQPKFYVCPSAPRSIHMSLSSPGEDSGGKQTYTAHYYGIMGPKGLNPGRSTPTVPVNYLVEGIGGQGDFSRHGVLTRARQRGFQDIVDGNSNTFLVGELSWIDANTYRVWIRGCNGNAMASSKNVVNPINGVAYNGNNNFNDVSFGSMHPGGCHFVYCDGAVRFINDSVDMNAYKGAASMDGRETQVAQ